ncbi:MAG: TetR/AcrR family transcriptional regulator [Myxococcota bacterium]|nr:TetR/AcrR family transcriptional regulator [Myxococcota bacterium]
MAGRPPGPSDKGRQTRERLYRTALLLFAEQGYEQTTLRGIAKRAQVSPGLLYRYFPSKQALVLELYASLSSTYAASIEGAVERPWSQGVREATLTSLQTLSPHRETLRALLGVLVSPGEDSLFGANTRQARERVQGAFHAALERAPDRPDAWQDLALLAWLGHLAVILFWLLDRSPGQRASTALLEWVPWGAMGLALRLPGVGAAVSGLATLVREGLLGEPTATPTKR